MVAEVDPSADFPCATQADISRRVLLDPHSVHVTAAAVLRRGSSSSNLALHLLHANS
jgi:hypothetical protein